MKKISYIAIIIFALISSCLLVTYSHADIKGTIKSASEYDYPPFCIVSKENKADGFSVELLSAALQAVDLDVDFQVGTWAEVQEKLKDGRVQVLPLVGRTPEREGIFDFTFTYLTLHGAIFVRKGDTRIEMAGDLADKEIIVMQGDNAEEYVKRERISPHIISVETYDKAMKLLESGKHDAVIAQRLMGIQLLRNLGISEVVPVEHRLDKFKQDFSFAVKEGDKELLALLNEGLSIVMADGTFERLYEKWFTPILGRLVSSQDMLKYVLIIGLPVMLLLLLIFTFYLRAEVKRKTKGLHQEMEERKKAAEALLESERGFKILVENSPLAMSLINKDGVIEYINTQYVNMMGYEHEEIPTLEHWWSRAYRDEETRNTTISEWQKTKDVIFSSGWKSEKIERRIFCKDGTSKDVEIIIAQVSGKILVVFYDVTERKRTEEVLKSLATRFMNLSGKPFYEMISQHIARSLGVDYVFVGQLNSTSDSVTILGGYARGETMDELTYELADTPCDNVMGKHVCFYPSSVTSQFPKDILLVQMEIEGYIGAPLFDKQHKPIGIMVALSTLPLSNPQASIQFFDMFLDRVAAEMQRGTAEEEKEKLQAQLMQAEKLEAVGQLAGGIAHDFNNILSAIMNNVHLSKRFIDHGNKAYERLELTEKALKKATGLTQQLLTFSKGGEPIKRTISLAKLIDESAGFALSGSNVSCKFSAVDNLWPVEADEGQINRVIHNLVVNADQSMPEGGTIQVRAENYTLSSDSELPLEEGRYIKIVLHDEGIGISPDNLQKIFDPYFSTKQKGSGLGLAVSYSIIQNHDGYIVAESEQGAGTTFTIYLPASDEYIAYEDNPRKKIIAGEGRILIMDDDEMVRNSIGEMIKFSGYEVAYAKDGEEAIDVYIKAMKLSRPFDAVIMDLTIPGGMGGKEAISRLREEDPDVKAIVSSGYSDDAIMAKFWEYGFSDVLPKPCSPDKLSSILYKLLNASQT